MLKPKMYHIRGEHSDHYNADAVLEKNTIQPKRRLKPGPLDIILNGNHLRIISSRVRFISFGFAVSEKKIFK